MRRLRNWVAGGMAVLLALSVVAGDARAADRKLRVSIIPIVDVAPLVVAMKKGFFAEEGLEIDTSPTAGGAVGIPGLMGGAFDIAFGNVVSSVLAANQGLDIKVIAAGTKVSKLPATAEMVARKSDNFKSGTEFHGKTIAVNTRNNVIWLYARAWVKARGGDPDKVTYKEVPFPQMNDALKRNQVDAAFMVDPFLTAAREDATLAVIGSPYTEVQPGVEVGQYITTTAFATQNAEVVAKFARALRKGIAWYNANMSNPELFQMVAELTKLPVDKVKQLPPQVMPSKIEVAQVQKTIELMREHGILTSGVDTAKFMHPIAIND